MTTYVYHYCASYQRTPGALERSDGIVTRSKPVTEYVDLESVKKSIAEIGDWPADGFTLDSFSFLHQTED